MASILNVDQINNAAGTNGIVLDASTGKASFPSGLTLPSGVGGKILQVVTNYWYANVQTTIASTSDTETNTSLRTSITPSSTNSYIVSMFKIAGQCATSWGRPSIRASTDGGSSFRGLKPSSGAGSLSQAYYGFSMQQDGDGGFPLLLGVDYPATTSAVIYNAFGSSTGGGNIYFPHQTSHNFVTLFEVSG